MLVVSEGAACFSSTITAVRFREGGLLVELGSDIVGFCLQEDNVKKPEEEAGKIVRKSKKQLAQARLKNGSSA